MSLKEGCEPKQNMRWCTIHNVAFVGICIECHENLPPVKDVTKQPHYTQFVIQPAEFILRNKLGHAEGCIIKYVCRYPKKNGVEDLRKARHYLDMLIEREEKGTVTP